MLTPLLPEHKRCVNMSFDEDDADDDCVFITPLLPARAVCMRVGQTPAPPNL